MENELLARAYDRFNKNKAQRLRLCALSLVFHTVSNGVRVLEAATFCNNWLCPICSWRRSLKISRQIARILSAVENTKPKSYLLLTLTASSCTKEKLNDKIEQLMNAWTQFIEYLPVKKAIKGWYRGTEIMHNVDDSSENYDTYSPYFKLLIAVNKSYFTDTTYISQTQWDLLWKQANDLNPQAQANVYRIKGSSIDSIEKSAQQSIGGIDYILPDDWALTVDTIRTLEDVLDNRNLIGFGGIFKDWHTMLNLDDPEKGDLNRTSKTKESSPNEKCSKQISSIWYSGYRQYFTYHF